MVEYIVAIDVTRVRFPADAYIQQIFALSCATRGTRRRAEELRKDWKVVIRRWVNSSVVRAADCRSAGPWLKSGLALYRVCGWVDAAAPAILEPTTNDHKVRPVRIELTTLGL